VRALRALAAPAAVLAAAALAAAPARAEPGAAALACGDARGEQAVVARLRAGQHLDAHGLAQALDLLCPDDATAAPDMRFRLKLLDALALLELDEPVRARALLAEAAGAATATAPVRRRAALLSAWSHLRGGDEAAFRAALPGLDPEARERLGLYEAAGDARAFAAAAAAMPSAPPPDLLRSAEAYRQASRTKLTGLAGTLSAVLPGLGQAYAGSWQAAAVALVLNAAFIGATVELVRRELYFTGAAAGLGASFFYVGNIINAVDLAGQRNERAAAEPRRALERLLVPEAHP
jgi:hypothetical protein